SRDRRSFDGELAVARRGQSGEGSGSTRCHQRRRAKSLGTSSGAVNGLLAADGRVCSESFRAKCRRRGFLNEIRGFHLRAGGGAFGQTRGTMTASGPFDAKLTPQPMHDQADKSLGRMSVAKEFHGDLEATSVAEMLTADTDVKGSGVYVAVERVTGTLKGRK